MARVLYVSEAFTPHDRRFLERLAETRHEILHQPLSDSRTTDESQILARRVRQLKPFVGQAGMRGSAAWIPLALQLRRVIRRIQPELIHAGPIQTGALCAALAGFHPLIAMSWGMDLLVDAERSPWMKWKTKFTLNRADAVVADCEAVRRKVASLSSSAGDRVICFPWGIDLARFRPDARPIGLRQILGWNSCRIVVNARGFGAIHGTMVFLEAMKRVLQALPDVRVLMLGDGSLRPEVEKFVRKHQLAEKIHLAGRVPEEMLPRYFTEADMYVSSALCDGSSISLLEAMGCGLAVVVSDSGGNPEWVVHEDNGWLCRPGDAESLAAVVAEALGNDGRRRIMGQKNAAIARARANWDQNFLRLLAAYDSLLAAKQSTEAERNAQLQYR